MVLLVVALLALPALPFGPLGGLWGTASAVDVPDDGLVHDVTEDWTISTTLLYQYGTVIRMIGANVTVISGGKLTLDNSTLLFNTSGDGASGLEVRVGGGFVMRNNATLVNDSPYTYYCGFLEGATVDLDGSNITGAYGQSPYMPYDAGVYFKVGSATVDNMTFKGSFDARNLAWFDGDGGVVRNSTFLVNLSSASSYCNAVSVRASTEIYDSVVRNTGVSVNGWNTVRGIWAQNAVLTLENVKVDKFVVNIYGVTSTINIKACRMTNASLIGWTPNPNGGLWVEGGSNASLKGNYFDNNRYAITAKTGSDLNFSGGNVITSGWTWNGLTVDDSSFNASRDQFGVITMAGARGNTTNCTFNYTISLTRYSNINISDARMDNSGFSFDQSSSMTLVRSKVRATWQLMDLRGASRVTFEGNEIDSAGFGSMRDGSVFESRNNNYTHLGQSLTISSNSRVTSVSDVMGSFVNAITVFNVIGSRLEVRNLKAIVLTGTTVAWAQAGSDVSIYNTTITGTGGNRILYASGNGHILSVNSSITSEGVTATDTAVIEIGWYATVLTEWQNGATAPFAAVLLNDSVGTTTHTLETDADGSVNITVIDFTVKWSNTMGHNPYKVDARLNGTVDRLQTWVDSNMVGNDSIVLTLIDYSMPNVSITSPTNGTVLGDGHVRISGTATDNGSGLSSVVVSNGTGGWVLANGLANWSADLVLAEGAHAIKARALDIANSSAEAVVTITVDLTKPFITVLEPAGPYVNTTRFDVTGLVEPGSTVTVAGVNATVFNGTFSAGMELADGDYHLLLRASDQVGNSNETLWHVIVDTVPPVLICDAAGYMFVNSMVVTFTGRTDGARMWANDLEGTIDGGNMMFSVDVLLANGPNEVTLVAVDPAGNRAMLTFPVTVDLDPPVIKVTSPRGSVITYTNVSMLDLEGTVTGAMELLFNGDPIKFDGRGGFVVPFVLSEGRNELDLMARDIAGNSAFWSLVMMLDTRPPVVTITEPAGAKVYTNVPDLVVSGSVDEMDAKLTYSGASVNHVGGRFSFPATLGIGENLVTIVAVDLAGNTGTTSVMVVLDTAASLTVTSPSDKDSRVGRDTVRIAGTSEPGGKVYVNSVLVSRDDGSFSVDWPLKGGKNTLEIKVVDQAGNTLTETITVTREEGGTSSDLTMVAVGSVLGLILGILVGATVMMVLAKRRKDRVGHPEPPQPTPPPSAAVGTRREATPETGAEEKEPMEEVMDMDPVAGGAEKVSWDETGFEELPDEGAEAPAAPPPPPVQQPQQRRAQPPQQQQTRPRPQQQRAAQPRRPQQQPRQQQRLQQPRQQQPQRPQQRAQMQPSRQQQVRRPAVRRRPPPRQDM